MYLHDETNVGYEILLSIHTSTISSFYDSILSEISAAQPALFTPKLR